jgi:hypothetical protein
VRRQPKIASISSLERRTLCRPQARDFPATGRESDRNRGSDQIGIASAREGASARVDVTIMTDRTQTIRASIEDVQTTIAVTIIYNETDRDGQAHQRQVVQTVAKKVHHCAGKRNSAHPGKLRAQSVDDLIRRYLA